MSSCESRIKLLVQNKVRGKREIVCSRETWLGEKGLSRSSCGAQKIYISSYLSLLAINKTDFNRQLVFNYKAFIPLLNKN